MLDEAEVDVDLPGSCAWMACQLARVEGVRVQELCTFEGGSRAGAMRSALQRNGEMEAGPLALAGGVTTSLVSSILKHDIKTGRIAVYKRQGGRQVYLLKEVCEEEREAVQAAAALLRRKGWTVTAPGGGKDA